MGGGGGGEECPPANPDSTVRGTPQEARQGGKGEEGEEPLAGKRTGKEESFTLYFSLRKPRFLFHPSSLLLSFFLSSPFASFERAFIPLLPCPSPPAPSSLFLFLQVRERRPRSLNESARTRVPRNTIVQVFNTFLSSF